jgi:endonuclease I
MNHREYIIQATNGLVGDELKTKLYEMYSPLCNGEYKRFSYKAMRKILYSELLSTNGDIYGGHNLENVPKAHINCEHVWPQSFFKGRSPMKSDMNHCFASHYKLNTHRSNKKFDEIDDDEAEYLNQVGEKVDDECLSTGSDSDLEDEVEEENQIDSGELCEKSNYNNTFEPRDVSKGNIARAIAYFNTMYPKYDISKVIDIRTLIDWHHADPVDGGERKRVDVIYEHQRNLNPFIVCPELVARVYLVS